MRSLCCDAWQSFWSSRVFWVYLLPPPDLRHWLDWERCVKNKDHAAANVMLLLQPRLLSAWAKPGLLTPAYFKENLLGSCLLMLVQPLSVISDCLGLMDGSLGGFSVHRIL